MLMTALLLISLLFQDSVVCIPGPCGSRHASGSSASDDFNRANNASLGANWAAVSGSFEILGNAAVGNTGGFTKNFEVWIGNTFSNDQFSQVTFVSRVSNEAYGVCVRMDQSPSGDGYCLLSDGVDLTIKALNQFSGATTLATDAGAGGLSSGTVMWLGVHGSNLTAKINGTIVMTATDSTLTTGGPGIWSSANAAGGPTLDDWSGGDN